MAKHSPSQIRGALTFAVAVGPRENAINNPEGMYGTEIYVTQGDPFILIGKTGNI